jgi:prephenate dehydrogenase
MWAYILLYNGPALDEALERTVRSVEELRRLIAAGDTTGLAAYLESARTFRQGIER